MNSVFARCAAAVAVVACGFVVVTVGAVPAGAIVGAVTQTLNVAALEPCCGNPIPGASGTAQSNVLVKTGTAEADVFSASVTLPHQSLGLTNSPPSSTDIRLVLSRGGVDYAECFLVAIFNDDNGNSESSTFVVNIVKVVLNSGTIFKQLAGKCDVDLGTAGVQPGVPAVQTDDVATAVNIVNYVGTDFLSGTFVQP
jgi:hypothetical protein